MIEGTFFSDLDFARFQAQQLRELNTIDKLDLLKTKAKVISQGIQLREQAILLAKNKIEEEKRELALSIQAVRLSEKEQKKNKAEAFYAELAEKYNIDAWDKVTYDDVTGEIKFTGE